MKKVKRFQTAFLCVCILAGVTVPVASATTATVNGKNADEVRWYSNDYVEVIYTFPVNPTNVNGMASDLSATVLTVPTSSVMSSAAR